MADENIAQGSPQSKLVAMLTERLAWIFVFIGIVLLVLSAFFSVRIGDKWISRAIQATLNSFGGILFSLGIIQVCWDYFVKKSLREELLELVGISTEIEKSGIVEVKSSFSDIVDWKDFCHGTSSLKFFFSYSFRSDYDVLQQFLTGPKKKATFVFPDPKSEVIINELSLSFQSGPEDLRRKIKESVEKAKSLSSSKSKVSVKYFDGMSPRFSCYINDRFAIIAFYNHNKERSSVPAMKVSKGGFMYDWIDEQFNNLQKSGSDA